MLNRREEKIMDEIYSLCKGDGKSLISAADFSRLFEAKDRLPEEKLEKIFEDLREDDYAETLYSHRKGEKMYLFTLRAKGYCYPREKENKKRDKALKSPVPTTMPPSSLARFIKIYVRARACAFSYVTFFTAGSCEISLKC